MTVSLKSGNAADLRLIHVKTSPEGVTTEEEVTLPFKMPVVEAGHSGCGVHDWHLGNESFKALLLMPNAVTLQVAVDPDLGSVDKICEITLLPVEITEVSFDGVAYWKLKNDDATKDYAAPQWKDLDGNGNPTNTAQGEQNNPVAYTQQAKPKIGATFKIAAASALGAIQIKASGPDGIEIPATAATVIEDTVSLPLTESSTALPETIKCYDAKTGNTAFKLTWKLKAGTADWIEIGETKHNVYVILSSQAPTLRQETLFDIACRTADGKTAAADVIAGIWSRLATRKIKPNQATGGIYLKFQDPLGSGIINTAILLANKNGQCKAWGDIFLEALKVQGIASNQL